MCIKNNNFADMERVITHNIITVVVKMIAYIGGAIVGFFAPMFPFLIVCTLAIVFDCITAWQLAYRVKKTTKNGNDGKFRSSHAMRMFNTMFVVFGVVVLSFCIDKMLIPDIDLYLANIVSAVFCMVQLVSILENVSSCNNARWAEILQKVLVDKTKRHLDIDISDKKK